MIEFPCKATHSTIEDQTPLTAGSILTIYSVLIIKCHLCERELWMVSEAWTPLEITIDNIMIYCITHHRFCESSLVNSLILRNIVHT